MSTVREDLQAVSKTLSTLAKDLAKIARQVDKLETAKKTAAKPAKKAAPKKAAGKAKPAAKKAAAKKAPAKKAPAAKKEASAAGASTVLDQVYEVVRRSRSGATIAKLKEKTGLDARQLSNALYKLSKRGKIEALSRGHYVKKKA